MIGAPPLLFGYLIFAALALELCLQLGRTMTLLPHYRLASSGDPVFRDSFFLSSFRVISLLCHLAEWWTVTDGSEQRPMLRFFF
jgi:hypothetical protein